MVVFWLGGEVVELVEHYFLRFITLCDDCSDRVVNGFTCQLLDSPAFAFERDDQAWAKVTPQSLPVFLVETVELLEASYF